MVGNDGLRGGEKDGSVGVVAIIQVYYEHSNNQYNSDTVCSDGT